MREHKSLSNPKDKLKRSSAIITWGNKCVVFSLEELGFFLIPQFDWVGGANSRIRKKLIPQFQINGDNEIFFVELEKT